MFMYSLQKSKAQGIFLERQATIPVNFNNEVASRKFPLSPHSLRRRLWRKVGYAKIFTFFSPLEFSPLQFC